MTAERHQRVRVHDTRLYVIERGGPDAFPVIVLHGGPGLDHHEFAHYLDPLATDGRYRLVLVDQRAQGRSSRDAPAATWTLHTMASDVSGLAAALGVERYAVLGHSFGGFVALQHAVDAHGAAVATIVSAAMPSVRFMAGVEQNLMTFEPPDLRQRVESSWEREAEVRTAEDFARIVDEQMPFNFASATDPRIAEYQAATASMVYAPDVLRHFAAGYGGIEVEAELPRILQPLLVLAGRHDRVSVPAASEAIAAGAPHAELVVFERSGHLAFVEENAAYVAVVRNFLDRVTAGGQGTLTEPTGVAPRE